MKQNQSAARVRRVVITAVAVVALAGGYCAADLNDVVPGVLTLQDVKVKTYTDPQTAKGGEDVVASADDNVTIDAAKAQDVLNTLISAAGVGSDVSAIIEDAQGNIAAEHESSTPREPASTMKTLTALAASTTLDMASTLDTQVFLTQGDDSNVLTLKGNGDMLLSAGENDSAHVNGRAGLTTLAKGAASALKKLGISSVTLVKDDSLFGTDRTPSRIQENNGDYLYYTPVSSMAIDGGRQRAEKLANPDESEDYPTLSQNTAADTANTFASLLKENGIEVTGDIVDGTAPIDSKPIASVSSATLQEILAFTLRNSDNTLAEEFGRLVALKRGADNTPTGATQAVRDALNDAGIDTTGLTMSDCSGLSPGSSVSVRTLAAVQVRNLSEGSGASAAEGLSVTGLTGTAKNRYTSDDAIGLLRVKTGSLGEVTSMSGNVSRANGGTLAFAVIVNNPTDYSAAREAITRFASSLVDL